MIGESLLMLTGRCPHWYGEAIRDTKGTHLLFAFALSAIGAFVSLALGDVGLLFESIFNSGNEWHTMDRKAFGKI